jgi:outer membrane lipoprotein SlyB
VRKKNQSAQGATASPDDMQNRIDRLEGLVLSLMTNGPQAAGPAAAAAAIAGNNIAGSVSGSSQDQAIEGENGEPIEEDLNEDDSEVDHVTKSMGVMKVDPTGKAFFASEAHWYAILGEVYWCLL